MNYLMNCLMNHSSRHIICLLCVITALYGAQLRAKTSPPNSIMGYQSQYIEANGINFHYVSAGEGQVILFLHGYPFFGAGWAPLMDRFKNTHRVIAPDLRGYGFTDKPQGVNQYHLNRLVEDVKALKDALSPTQKIILIGHDWGGALAWAVGQVHPDIIEKLVVINAPPPNVLLMSLASIEEQQKASSYMPLLKSDAVEQAFRQSGPDLLWRYGFDKMLEKGFITDDYKNAFFKSWEQNNAITSAMHWYRANIPKLSNINDDTIWPSKNARVTIASLLITSENEKTFVPATFALTKDYVDDLTVKLVPGAGHTPFFENPKKVEVLIRDFIAN